MAMPKYVGHFVSALSMRGHLETHGKTSAIFINVGVVVPCVCVSMYVSVRSILPPRASRPQNIDSYVRVHRNTEKVLC